MTDRPMTDDARTYRIGGELRGVDECEEIARQVKCDLETTMEANPDDVVTVGITVDEVGHRER